MKGQATLAHKKCLDVLVQLLCLKNCIVCYCSEEVRQESWEARVEGNNETGDVKIKHSTHTRDER